MSDNEEIHIDIREKGSKKHKKYYRRDETWTKDHEKVVNSWKEKCVEASEKHNISGKSNKCRHAIFGLPSVLLPIIFSPVCIALDGDESLPYVSMVGFILSGMFSGINSFFNYSGKHQKHMDYSSRYSDIVTDIEYEMSIGREFREDPDSWLTRLQAKFDYTGAGAPDL